MTTGRLPPRNDNQNSGNKDNPTESKSYQRRYSDYFEFVPVGYFTFDRSGVILNVNPSGALLLDSDRDSLLNQSFSAYIAPDSRDIFRSHSRQLFKSRKKQTCDLELINGNGRSRWIQLESVTVQNDNGDSDYIRTVINEITDRKLEEESLRKVRNELEQMVFERTAEIENTNEHLRAQISECEYAEAALRESEEKYSTLVEDALIGVYINRDGKIDFANDKFATIYGYPKDELIGMDSAMLVHPEDRLLVKELREKRLKGENVPSEYEIRGLKKNGDTIWVMRSLSVINYKDGLAISGIVQDMTKRRKAEEALRESDKELRILSNQLLSAEEKERKRIARELHDGIGQALSAIKFSVEHSLRELRNSPDHAELKSLETVIPLTQKTIEEVRRIVKDLRPSILDDLGILATINWFCREFQNVYSSIQIQKDVDIQEKDIPSPLKTVIYRILQEALNNVAKHSRAYRVNLSLHLEDDGIELKVNDNGRGFDLTEAISLKPSRRGFGLASMRERAQLSGANFEIKSAAGEGTTIRVKWETKNND
ncbi:MAG: PAS domain S-box protein [bacterium]|nr:PAS domain S-box protein [bacterium]